MTPLYSVRGCWVTLLYRWPLLLWTSQPANWWDIKNKESTRAAVPNMPPQHLLIERCFNMSHPTLPFSHSAHCSAAFPPVSLLLSSLSLCLLITALCVGFFSGKGLLWPIRPQPHWQMNARTDCEEDQEEDRRRGWNRVGVKMEREEREKRVGGEEVWSKQGRKEGEESWKANVEEHNQPVTSGSPFPLSHTSYTHSIVTKKPKRREGAH